MMNQAIKEKWVAALRSGEYQQCTGALCREGGGRDADKFCCLGVLCDIMQEGEWKPAESLYGNKRRFSIGDSSNCNKLPLALLDRTGISMSLENRLLEMNDNGETFAQIADYIEENL